MSAEVERNLLNHYQLSTLYPSEWPKRDDESDPSDNEQVQPVRRDDSVRSSKAGQRASRFSGLDTKSSFRSRLSGSKEIGSGSGNIVQKDEPDPLGISPSVVSSLRAKGLSVEDNLKLRNKFMLSSTTFSPALFLSNVHQTATIDDLLQGLDFLSRSIEKKSASLKVLVESNFERFVKAKATIDNVYTEMRTQGAPVTPSPTKATHSRMGSRNGPSHFRNTSGNGPSHFRSTSNNGPSHFRSTSNTGVSHLRSTSNTGPSHLRTASNPFSPPGEDHRKTALTKESEYGVLGIKTPLIELAVKAEEVWGPALGGKDRGEDLKSTLTFVERNRDLFRIAGNVQGCIRRQDHEGLVEEYQKAKAAVQEVQALLISNDNDPSALTEPQLYKVLATAKMWHDVESQVSTFRRTALRQIASMAKQVEQLSADERRDSQTDLIVVLLQLGIQENPIWLSLSSWHGRVRDNLVKSSERARLDIEILRRRLAAIGEPAPHQIKAYFESAAQKGVDLQRNRMDSPQVIQFWELVDLTFQRFMDPKTGILGDIIEFADKVQSYVEGRAQKDLPNSVWTTEESRRHLKLSREHVAALQDSINELVAMLRDAVLKIFLEPPIEDISDIFSPAPITPDTTSPPLSPADKLRIMGLDEASLPPPTPKIGEIWEKFAFWPPHANALSGSSYLSKILILVGGSASEASAISVLRSDPRGIESLRNMVSSIRERCVQAVCAAWNNDAENIKLLEDWSRSGDRKDLTNMPARFTAFEESVLADTQKILFLSDAMTRADSGQIVASPPSKLLQAVRSQFVTSLYKALSGTVENAEKSRQAELTGDHGTESLLISAHSDLTAQESGGQTILLGRNVRMLLTLSNLKYLQQEIIPGLINYFESSFSVQLTDESNTIRDVLGQIDTRLFQSYVGPTVQKLNSLIARGVADKSWIPNVARPTNAKPYVYEMLLELVLVHTEVTTNAATMTTNVLSHHLEQISRALLEAFRKRPSYTLSALMQATLDVELTAQTLSNYSTETASEIQSQIYLILDERTDHEARSRLQNELPEMRATLKRLRENTKGQFGCFKRERRDRGRERIERPDGRGGR